ncbi:MAG: hypothetical protein AAF290_12620 [Pseudomonadota bacterium]
MTTKISVVALLLVTLAAIAWQVNREPTEPRSPSAATEQAPAATNPNPNPKPLSAENDASTSAPADTVDMSVDQLELALAAAIEMREQAEAALADSEQAVEELEAYVAEIEARGEDPADYAEEGMKRFQPAFFAYQDAISELEQAELIESEARKALAAARNR